jgi:molybdate transport system substrate-binding protein
MAFRDAGPSMWTRLLGLLLTLAMLACARDPSQELTVFAASSLREAFTDLGHAFEATHPGTHVRFEFAGSQALRTQLEHGADPDIFASADAITMAAVADRMHPPVVFACNEPVLVVTRGVQGIATFADLPRLERVVLGAPEVPIGRYTDEILAHSGTSFAQQVRQHVVSREPNVRQVLAKVTLGEAQAAIVYRTDALVAGTQVQVLDIPRDVNPLAHYPIAVRTGARSALAQAFVDFTTSDTAWKLLSQRGFSRCPTAKAP